MAQVRHEDQVLLAGELVIHRRKLAGDADRGADRIGLTGEIVAGDAHLAGVGGDERGQDLNGCGLTGAVRSEQ
jgi:hypothetical protein